MRARSPTTNSERHAPLVAEGVGHAPAGQALTAAVKAGWAALWSLAGRRITRDSKSETMGRKWFTERAIPYAHPRGIQMAWPTVGKQLGHDAVDFDRSPRQTVMDTGLVQRGLCVEAWQRHGYSPFASVNLERKPILYLE